MRRTVRRSVSTFTALCLGLATFVGALAIAPSAAIAAKASRGPSVGAKEGKAVEAHTMRVSLGLKGKSGGAAKAVQASSFTAPTQSFDGLDSAKGDTYEPDAQIDVGPEHVVEVISSYLAVYNKAGTKLGETSIADFFAAASTGTSCSPANEEEAARLGDSSVMYDTLSDRWFVVTQAYDDLEDGPYRTCIAASTTGNPLDTTWNVYTPKIFGKGDIYPNNFKYGLWRDGLYVAADVDCGDNATTSVCPFSAYVAGPNDVYSFVGVQLWGFNREDMLSGSALRWQTTVGTGRVASSSQTFDSFFYQEVHPASFRKQTGVPPDPATDAAGGAYFLENDDPWGERTGITMWKWRVNWDTPASSTITAPVRVGNGASIAGGRDDIPVPSGNDLWTNYTYLSGRVQYVNQTGSAPLGGPALVAVHNFENGSGATLRTRSHWFRFGLNGSTGALLTSGTGSGNNQWMTANNQGNNWPATNDLDRWQPSVAVDKNGNLALVHQTANARVAQPPTSLVALRYTGRLAGDLRDTITQPETTIVQGTGYQIGDLPDDGGPNDWFGDQTQTVLDPDGCTFWTVGQYYDTVPVVPEDVHWVTKIASFGYPSGECARDLLETSVTTSGSAVEVGEDTGVLTATLTGTGTGSGIGGKTITFSLGDEEVGSAVTNNKGVATLTGVDVSDYEAGVASGVVDASFAGSTDTYASSAGEGDLSISGGTDQGIDFAPLDDKTFGDADFGVSATADSALDVTFSASGKCSVSGTTVHIKGAGSCTVTASQAGNWIYAAAEDVSRTFAIAKASQSVSLGAQADNNVGQAKNLTVTSATPPARTVEWTVDNGNCKVQLSNILNGARITSLHVGTCNVTASLPGDENYNAASDTKSFTIGKGTQTLTVSPNQATRTINQIDHQVTHSWNSGLPDATFVAENAGPWTATSTGGNGTQAVFTLAPAAHSMQVGTRVTISGSDVPAYDGTYTVTAVAANTITVLTAATGAVTTAGVAQALTVCSNVGNDVTVAHTGACRISASNPGDDDWLPGSGSVVKGITKGTQGTTSGAPATGSRPVLDGAFDVTLSLNAAPTSVTPELRASGLSPGNVDINAADKDINCSVGSTTNNGDGTATATITPIQGGTCRINATGNVGNDDWNAKAVQTSVVTYTLTKANQTIEDFDPIDDRNTESEPFEVSATATSGLTVTFSSLTTEICTVEDTTVSLTGTEGVCTIRASQAGNGVYNAAPNVDRTFEVIGRDPQTIDFPAQGNHTYGDPDFDPGATASSELEVTYTSATPSICTIVDNKVHIQNFKVKNGAGTCTVTAHQDGDFFYQAAPPVSKSFTAYTQAKIALKYVKPKKNVPWGGSVKITVKVTAPKRKPSGLVTIYVAPKGSDEWVEAATVNYPTGKKKVLKAITAPCGPSKGKYQVQVTFTDNAGSQQTVTGKKPKPFQLKKSGVC